MAERRTELYFIRHGESAIRAQPNLIGGHRNEAPLTHRGVEQAKALGKYLLARDILPTRVYASQAIRNIKTAEHSLRAMGLDLDILVEEALQGWDEGEWVGKNRDEVYTETTLAEMDQRGLDFAPPSGESMRQIGMRTMGWADSQLKLSEATETTERIFAYSHGITIGCAAGIYCGWTQAQIDQTKIGNTSLTLFSTGIGTGDWQLEYIGRLPA